MPIFRTDTDQVVDANGNVLSTTTVQRDVTRPANLTDLTTKARQAITANDTFLALASPTAAQTAAQVKALTREVTGIIRLLGYTIDQLADLGDTTTGT